MAEVNFGKLVSRVLARMDFVESDLTTDERNDSYKALQHYKQALVEEIRAVFDEADAPAPVVPTCRNCGAPVGAMARYCSACRMPLTPEAAAETLEGMFAEDLGMGRDDPRLREKLARVREESPDQWTALVQKLTVPAKA